MKLYVVRHGQTDFNAGNLMQGSSDIPLNATGEAQARELAKTVKDMYFDAYYVSPLRRARQTAEIITDDKVQFTVDNRLRERTFGEIEGKKFDLSMVGDLEDRRTNISPYGIEPINTLLARAKSFLDDLKANHAPDETILVVAHGALLRALHFNIVGYDDDTDLLSFHPNNCELKEYNI